MKNPTPGSKEAQDLGCICAVMDNNYGKGIPSKDGPQFWITGGCPVHAPTQAAEEKHE